jgi:hypothetical protein
VVRAHQHDPTGNKDNESSKDAGFVHGAVLRVAAWAL